MNRSKALAPKLQAALLGTLMLALSASVSALPACQARDQPPADAKQVQGDTQSSVVALLDASAELATFVKRTKWFTETSVYVSGDPFEEFNKVEYPSHVPAALEARRMLFSHIAAAVPGMLSELAHCDLDTDAGSCRAYFADRWLAEAAGGHFGWRIGLGEEVTAHNRCVVESWNSLWSLTKDHQEFWSGKRAAGADYPRPTMETQPLSFIDLETVMAPSMRIAATTPSGTMTIGAENGFWRTYEWEGASRAALLEARDSRWDGSLGLYYAGPGDHWEDHGGITRGVLQEGQQHFKTIEEALAWIQAQSQSASMVYRNDGLAVSWAKTPTRQQLNVDVWQITIDGKPPAHLPGSQDEAIVVSK
jgi:hypothetical protein